MRAEQQQSPLCQDCGQHSGAYEHRSREVVLQVGIGEVEITLSGRLLLAGMRGLRVGRGVETPLMAGSLCSMMATDGWRW